MVSAIVYGADLEADAADVAASSLVLLVHQGRGGPFGDFLQPGLDFLREDAQGRVHLLVGHGPLLAPRAPVAPADAC